MAVLLTEQRTIGTYMQSEVQIIYGIVQHLYRRFNSDHAIYIYAKCNLATYEKIK